MSAVDAARTVNTRQDTLLHATDRLHRATGGRDLRRPAPSGPHAEALGFDGFFRSDHYLGTMGDGSPGPTDAWVTLAGLARETNRSGSAHGESGDLPPARAAGDHGGRGRRDERWSGGARTRCRAGTQAEHRAYGIPFPDLGRAFRPVSASSSRSSTGLWADAGGANGSPSRARYYQLADSPALPKPVQTPRPPRSSSAVAAAPDPRSARGPVRRRVQRPVRVATSRDRAVYEWVAAACEAEVARRRGAMR